MYGLLRQLRVVDYHLFQNDQQPLWTCKNCRDAERRFKSNKIIGFIKDQANSSGK